MIHLGGPFDGRRIPRSRLHNATPDTCARTRDGERHHYTHEGQGVYRHAGPCTDFDHDGHTGERLVVDSPVDNWRTSA